MTGEAQPRLSLRVRYANAGHIYLAHAEVTVTKNGAALARRGSPGDFTFTSTEDPFAGTYVLRVHVPPPVNGDGAPLASEHPFSGPILDFTQGFTATQYELLHLKEPQQLETAFLIDRSDGADAVLSNRSLAALQAESGPITVYLERGSLQRDMFHAFVTESGLTGHNFEFINSAQNTMLLIRPSVGPVILISYSPYLTQLQEHGFEIIASTHTLKSFAVVDGLFVDRNVFLDNKSYFAELKGIFDRALAVFRSDPRAYYESVRGYLEGETFEQFMNSTHNVVWLNAHVDPEILTHLRAQGVRVDQRIP